MIHNPTGKERLALAFLLSMLGILGPFNIDMYLPGFPDIADDFGARASLVQMSLTACLIGLAAGQIIVGPLSDSHGRRKPLLIGISLLPYLPFYAPFHPILRLLLQPAFCRD